MLTVQVNDSLAKAIDDLIKADKLYGSRSEFLKDAIRKNLLYVLDFQEKLKTNPSLKKIHDDAEKLALTSKQRGFTGKVPSKDEMTKWAIESDLKKGFISKKEAKALLQELNLA